MVDKLIGGQRQRAVEPVGDDLGQAVDDEHRGDSYGRVVGRADHPRAVVAMFGELPTGQGRRMFEQAVEHGIESVDDPPAPLVEFFAQVDAVPHWLNREQLAHGARTQARTGLHSAVLVMPGLSLYGGYLASRADKPLVRTGDLYAMAPRRLTETASWTVDLLTPGGLNRFSAGFKGVLRVRLMHALVRAGMSRRPDWDFADWDHPVNQVQMAGTILLFSLMNILGSQLLGLRFSGREKAAVLHLWRYVGHLIGVEHELLPVTEADAWRLLWLEAATEFRPDDDSTKLAEAMLAAMPAYALPPRLQRSAGARRALTNYVGAYSRLVLGKRNADRLRAPDNRALQAAILATAAITFVAETARSVIPGATLRSARRGYLAQRRLLDRGIRQHHGDRTFARHDRMAVT